MTLFIPIGFDCGVAGLLKSNSIRSYAYPFDWNLTYGGVSDIFKANFMNFIPDNTILVNNKCGNIYATSFAHDEFPRDSDKYTRRINRLISLLETSKDHLIFFRKGHAIHNHSEYTNIKNDLDDINELDLIFKQRYPNLHYTFIISLACSKCFNSSIVYTTQSKTIDIYNIVTDTVNNNVFNTLFYDILNKYTGIN